MEATGSGALAETGGWEIPSWEEMQEMSGGDLAFWQTVIEEQEYLEAENEERAAQGLPPLPLPGPPAAIEAAAQGGAPLWSAAGGGGFH